ncbi:MAG TPA: 3-hydroxyacyl-CoA dehydrogenase family protein [Acidisphaera sp.]|nr:3-hydroxyacyl-CoA dehydrogenase family protein [Acidisphaera sp.]
MSTVAVIGAGTMGHALALVYALGGHRVRLTDTNAQTLARAPALIETARATLAETGEIDGSWSAPRIADAIACTATLEDTVRGVDVVVEAIIEQPEAKRTLYAQLDALLADDAIIASNTSYLDVFPLVPERRQARTVIVHWYTPPYLVDLVDIAPGPNTDPAVVEHMRAMVEALGKVPIGFRTLVTGYVANRIQSAITTEVYRLLDEGLVTPDDVDKSVIHGLALRMPIVAVLAKADFTGLPLQQDALRNRTYTPPPPRDHSDTIDRLVAEGRTGVMAGRGFFDWGGRSPEDLFQERDRKLIALKQALRKIGRMEGS